MTELEDLVRSVLADHADDAPTPERLTDAVQLRRQRSRRARQMLAVAAVAAATAAAVVVPLALTSGHQPSQPGIMHPVPPANREQVIGFHGIEITVPASWSINKARCGTPVANTVLRDEGGVLFCLVPRPANVSSVELTVNNANGPAKSIRESVLVTNPHGVRLERGTAGREVGVIVLAAGVIVFLDTTSPALTQRIIDSIRIVDTDSTGCAMHETRLQPPISSAAIRGPYRPYVIAPGVTSIAICHYEDNWLMGGLTVDGAAASRIVEAANSAPNGFVHVPPTRGAYDSCNVPVSQGGDKGTGFILFAHDGGAPAQELWAHLGSCGSLGITNGVRAGALTLELARSINEPLRRGFGIPSHLLPGPG